MKTSSMIREEIAGLKLVKNWVKCLGYGHFVVEINSQLLDLVGELDVRSERNRAQRWEYAKRINKHAV